MNKTELIDAMAAGSGLSKADSRRALDAFIQSTMNAMKAGEKVALVGFGTWAIAKREARTGRNPQTGKEISIPAKKVVRFKPGSELTDLVK